MTLWIQRISFKTTDLISSSKRYKVWQTRVALPWRSFAPNIELYVLLNLLLLILDRIHRFCSDYMAGLYTHKMIQKGIISAEDKNSHNVNERCRLQLTKQCQFFLLPATTDYSVLWNKINTLREKIKKRTPDNKKVFGVTWLTKTRNVLLLRAWLSCLMVLVMFLLMYVSKWVS